MKKQLLTLMLLGAASVFGQVSLGISIGNPPPPRVVHARPRAPGADYNWVDGYWYANGKKWKWHDGYWTRPPYAGAHWVAPRYDGGRFFAGYWDGARRVEHDHSWDHNKNRDYYYDHH